MRRRFLSATLFLSSLALASYPTLAQKGNYHSYAESGERTIGSSERGTELYNKKCANCHEPKNPDPNNLSDMADAEAGKYAGHITTVSVLVPVSLIKFLKTNPEHKDVFEDPLRPDLTDINYIIQAVNKNEQGRQAKAAQN